MSGSGKIDELIEASRELYNRKLIHASGGNTSVRDGDVVRITQTGAELGKLTPEKIVTVDLEGKVLEGSGPSKEMDMHLAMYRARSNAQAVVHVHPTYAIAYSTLISGESSNAVPPYTAAFYVRAGRVPMISIIPLAPIRCMKPWRWRRITMRSSCASTASLSPAPTCRWQ